MVIHGWTVYAHSAFIEAYEALTNTVAALQQAHPDTYQTKKPTRLLAAIHKLAFDVIPKDPTLSKYRLGKTLGATHKHWFRAKFLEQYRLFFRYDLETKTLILAWVNDEDSLRAYGSKSDAYAVFAKRLKKGDPPDSWDELLTQASSEAERLDALVPQQPPVVP